MERDRDDRLDHRENHHQANTSGSGSDVKVRSVGNWSEHTSSSGKIYYYNCVTEVSRKFLTPSKILILVTYVHTCPVSTGRNSGVGL